MKWCRCLLVLFFVSAAYIPSGNPAMTKAAIKETQKMVKNMCKRSSGVKQESLNKYKLGEFPDDPKLKCYFYCCLKMIKTMKDNKLTIPAAIKQVETLLPDDMKEASLAQIDACKGVGGDDGCEIAFNFAKCSYDVNPNNMLIPY